jgi:uncharacterized membrane protein YbhN (UPF0104 family)
LIRLFGAKVNGMIILATVPIIFMLGALPLTPGGLGTVQVAMVVLLRDKIQTPLFTQGEIQAEELLFALSLSWMAVNYLLKALFGLYFWLSRPHTLFRETFSPPPGD